MNLYHISQTACQGYDTFSDAVVAAKTEDAARLIVPDFEYNNTDPQEVRHLNPAQDDTKESNDDDEWWFGSWPRDPKFVTARLIGKAVPGTVESVICASFHAG